MHFPNSPIISFLLPTLFLTAPTLAATAISSYPSPSSFLNVTAITAAEGLSRFECWQLDSSPLVSSTQPGVVGSQTTFLGDVANFTYNVAAPGFNGGFHNAPTNQWVLVLGGMGTITLPNSTETVTVSQGAVSLLFAADTADLSDLGHGSVFNDVTESIFLQAPTRDGTVPEHRILYLGPCRWPEYAGLGTTV